MEKKTNSKEDYLRVLYEELKTKKTMQSKDWARVLNVSRPSVSRMMTILKKIGYIEMEKYGSIKLTSKGQIYAAEIEKDEECLRRF